MEELTIRPLTGNDAKDLESLLQSQSPSYVRFFTPFRFDAVTLKNLLDDQKRDVYMGLFWARRLAGLFMLRGWDEGYDLPAFGILIDEKLRGSGLEMLSLETAKILCKLRGAPGMITKVHPSNMSAEGVLRKTGFALRGEEAQTGSLLYHFEIKSRRRKTG